MKYTCFLFFLFSVFSLQSQTPELNPTIQKFQEKINKASGSERLLLLDSLSNYIANETPFESDSIHQETVQLALALDSVNIATKQLSNRIYYYNNIKGNPAKGKELFDSFLENVKSVSSPKVLTKYYLEGADSHFFLGQHENSLPYYDLSIEAAQKDNNKRMEGLGKLYKGGALSSSAKFAKASLIIQEASKIFQETKDTFNILGAQNSLSVLYSQNWFFKEARAARKPAIALAKQIGSNSHLVSLYFNASIDARREGNQALRIDYLKKAKEASRKTRNTAFTEPSILGKLIVAYAQIDSINMAETYLAELESKEGYTQNRYYTGYLEAQMYLAFAKQQYTQALRMGEEYLAIIKEKNLYEEVMECEEFLAKVNEVQGNLPKAYAHYKEFKKYSDSIVNSQKTNSLLYYQTVFETEKRDLIIENQNTDIALLNAESKVKTQWLFFIPIALGSVFLLVFWYRSKETANNERRMQQEYAEGLLTTQDEERKRIAKELHDSVGQQLTLIKRKAQSEKNNAIATLTNTTLEEVREISRGLYPSVLKQLGLTESIENLIHEIDANTNTLLVAELEDVDAYFNEHEALNIYRFVQEALSNMLKHAQASSGSVLLKKQEDGIYLEIADNGAGFSVTDSVQKKSLGLKTLQERIRILNGKFKIDSALGKGTQITVTLPR